MWDILKVYLEEKMINKKLVIELTCLRDDMATKPVLKLIKLLALKMEKKLKNDIRKDEYSNMRYELVRFKTGYCFYIFGTEEQIQKE
jgi:hypothetical protein